MASIPKARRFLLLVKGWRHRSRLRSHPFLRFRILAHQPQPSRRSRSRSSIMRFPRDSVFAPNRPFSSSLTSERVDGFSTAVAQMDSPPLRSTPCRSKSRKNTSKPVTMKPTTARRSSPSLSSSKAGIHKRIMQFYAGNYPEAHARTAHKLDEYVELYGQPPIVPLGDQGPRGGDTQLTWKCKICNEDFPTFQKAAVHLTSGEWGLPNWRCPEKFWYVQSHSICAGCRLAL